MIETAYSALVYLGMAGCIGIVVAIVLAVGIINAGRFARSIDK